MLVGFDENLIVNFVTVTAAVEVTRVDTWRGLRLTPTCPFIVKDGLIRWVAFTVSVQIAGASTWRTSQREDVNTSLGTEKIVSRAKAALNRRIVCTRDSSSQALYDLGPVELDRQHATGSAG
jgi:hypothetical protein